MASRLWKVISTPAALEAVLEAAKPKFVNGSWRKPIVTGRKLATARSSALENGMTWPPDVEQAARRAARVPRPNKGRKADREKEARQKKIQDALAQQPKLLAAYRKERAAARAAAKARGKIGPGRPVGL